MSSAISAGVRVPRTSSAAAPAHHPLVVVGAGPVGLTLAIDLAQRGERVLLLDNDHRLSSGSRAICFAKRTLEIWDRLGVGQRMVDKGVSWSVGRVFFGSQQVYQFDMLPEPGHERPAFINLQQYYAEGFLVERAMQLPNLEIRWQNKVTAVGQDADHACADRRHARRPLPVDGRPRGGLRRFTLAAARDAGAGEQGPRVPGPLPDRRSASSGPLFENDATERWFWFDPPFHPGQSVLLHKQADNVWRMDFQLGWDADPDEEKKPERITPRVHAMMLRQGFGRDVPFELEWASVYTFACLRMDRFRHGRVLFAGDSAHGVSPFGARGANSGVQDADNLAWKLDRGAAGQAPDALLDSYAAEREFAADENLLNSRAPPTSSRPRARSASCSATRCWACRATSRSRAAWSTAGGCRCRPRWTARR
jgi:3-(3-hydroxy-phenyl)propionate hydroxylase